MPNDVEQFIENMGRRFEEEGGPRIAGRLFAALITNEKLLSLDELAEQLKVSKASVSTNARLLDQWGLVTRVTLPGDRRDYYQVGEDLPFRMLARYVGGLRRSLAVLRESRQALSADREVVRDRISRLVEAHERLAAVLDEALDEQRNNPNAGLNT